MTDDSIALEELERQSAPPAVFQRGQPSPPEMTAWCDAHQDNYVKVWLSGPGTWANIAERNFDRMLDQWYPRPDYRLYGPYASETEQCKDALKLANILLKEKDARIAKLEQQLNIAPRAPKTHEARVPPGLEPFVKDLLSREEESGLTLYEAYCVVRDEAGPELLVEDPYGHGGPTVNVILSILKRENWVQTTKTRRTYYVWKPSRQD